MIYLSIYFHILSEIWVAFLTWGRWFYIAGVPTIQRAVRALAVYNVSEVDYCLITQDYYHRFHNLKNIDMDYYIDNSNHMDYKKFRKELDRRMRILTNGLLDLPAYNYDRERVETLASMDVDLQHWVLSRIEAAAHEGFSQ